MSITFKAAADGECTLFDVTIEPTAPARWARSLDNEPVSFLYGAKHFDVIDLAMNHAAWILEFATLECARPHLYRQFTSDFGAAFRKMEGVDSDGVRLVAEDNPGKPAFIHEAYTTDQTSTYCFPSSISAKALPYLAMASGPHWEFWRIGYYDTLRMNIGYGNPTRLLREGVSTLQTALESSMIAVVGWDESKQYSHPTILQFPPNLQAGLASLLLTRNLMLHRGQLALKILRPGESWRDARGRDSTDTDGPLTSVHLLRFCDICFDALYWLEQARPALS